MRAAVTAAEHQSSAAPQVSTTAALHGSIAAFDGRVLHVRSAGEDAWLCRPAPLSVEHDVEPREQLTIDAFDFWGGADELADGALQVSTVCEPCRAALEVPLTRITSRRRSHVPTETLLLLVAPTPLPPPSR